MWILVYVNDLTVIDDNVTVIENIIKMNYHEFKCHDLENLKSFFGIEVTKQNDGSLMLTQARYAMDILLKFNMAICKPCKSPALSDTKLVFDEGAI